MSKDKTVYGPTDWKFRMCEARFIAILEWNVAISVCKLLSGIFNHNCKHARVMFGAQTSYCSELFINTKVRTKEHPVSL